MSMTSLDSALTIYQGGVLDIITAADDLARSISESFMEDRWAA